MAGESLISVGGVALPVEWQAAQVSVAVTPLSRGTIKRMEGGTGRRVGNATAGKSALEVSGTGLYPPALSAVSWASAVTIVWYSPSQASGEATRSMTILSDGIKTIEDASGATVSWSIQGEEA